MVGFHASALILQPHLAGGLRKAQPSCFAFWYAASTASKQTLRHRRIIPSPTVQGVFGMMRMIFL